MKKNQIAVILFTLRDFIQTEAGLERSLERVRSIGYENVQVSGIGPDGPSASFVRNACDRAGLTICATHEPSDLLLSNPEEIVDRLNVLDTEYTAYPFPKDVDFTREEAVVSWLEALEHATQVLRAAGKTLTYHNHAHEFYRLNGRLIYERIFEETSIGAELDTYWVQAGGASPLEWTRSLARAGRLPLLHMKDFKIEFPKEQRFAEIGSGNIDFKPIVEAADAGGCRHFIVEQDQCWGRDPFDCIKQSYDFMVGNLVSGA